jgi:hypothetical protein
MLHRRNLRVVKWLGTVPAIGVCTYCAMNFNVPSDKLKRTSDAQESLRKQFEEHKASAGMPAKPLRLRRQTGNDARGAPRVFHTRRRIDKILATLAPFDNGHI